MLKRIALTRGIISVSLRFCLLMFAFILSLAFLQGQIFSSNIILAKFFIINSKRLNCYVLIFACLIHNVFKNAYLFCLGLKRNISQNIIECIEVLTVSLLSVIWRIYVVINLV